MESSQNEEKEISLKIIILGDSNVGKTSILLKYVDGYFPTIYVATIGVEYKVKKITINGVDINLHIWDTAGQERFRSMTKSFMQNADGIIYVYDITQRESFNNLKTWIRESDEASEGFKKIIVGNKIDLENNRKIGKDVVEKFCEENNIKGVEMSAKEGKNIGECFEYLARSIIGIKTKDELLKTYTEEAREKGISIKEKKKKKHKKKCC